MQFITILICVFFSLVQPQMLRKVDWINGVDSGDCGQIACKTIEYVFTQLSKTNVETIKIVGNHTVITNDVSFTTTRSVKITSDDYNWPLVEIRGTVTVVSNQVSTIEKINIRGGRLSTTVRTVGVSNEARSIIDLSNGVLDDVIFSDINRERILVKEIRNSIFEDVECYDNPTPPQLTNIPQNNVFSRTKLFAECEFQILVYCSFTDNTVFQNCAFSGDKLKAIVVIEGPVQMIGGTVEVGDDPWNLKNFQFRIINKGNLRVEGSLFKNVKSNYPESFFIMERTYELSPAKSRLSIRHSRFENFNIRKTVLQCTEGIVTIEKTTFTPILNNTQLKCYRCTINGGECANFWTRRYNWLLAGLPTLIGLFSFCVLLSGVLGIIGLSLNYYVNRKQKGYSRIGNPTVQSFK